LRSSLVADIRFTAGVDLRSAGTLLRASIIRPVVVRCRLNPAGACWYRDARLPDGFATAVEGLLTPLRETALFAAAASILPLRPRKSKFLALSLTPFFGSFADPAAVLTFSVRRGVELSLAIFLFSSGRPATSIIFS
jgi:hypothetical protein